MAAIFYQVNPRRNIFRDALTVNTSIRIPWLDGLVGTNGFSIITDISINNSDTIQYFLTFDDFINYFYFGKGLGQIQVNGVMFTDCNGNTPGVTMFYDIIGANRGVPLGISAGGYMFTGVISSFAVTAESESMTTNFQLTLTIVHHNLQQATFDPLC